MLTDSSVSPSELIRDAKAGKPAAVGRLLELYLNYLKILATTQLDPKLRRRVSPSDVVQETVCEAHRDFPMFRGQSEGEFVAWLRQILIHNLARFVELHVLAEKRDIRRELSLNEMRRAVDRSSMQMDALLIGREGTPSGAALKRERGVLLADCLSQLPDDYREVVLLRNFKGLPFKEVAKEMNRSSGAVRMLWLRALEQLREKLSGNLEDSS